MFPLPPPCFLGLSSLPVPLLLSRGCPSGTPLKGRSDLLCLTYLALSLILYGTSVLTWIALTTGSGVFLNYLLSLWAEIKQNFTLSNFISLVVSKLVLLVIRNV